jgi:hypothetical protein
MTVCRHRTQGLRVKSSPNLWVRLKFDTNPLNASMAHIQRILFRDLGTKDTYANSTKKLFEIQFDLGICESVWIFSLCKRDSSSI